MFRCNKTVACLAIGLWSGAVCADPQLRPGMLDVAIEPLLVAPWLFYSRAGTLYAQNSNGSKPLRLQDSDAGAILRRPAAMRNGPWVIIAWTEKTTGGDRLQALTLGPDESPGKPIELASGLSSSVVEVLGDGQGHTYILDASFGPKPEIHVTAWNPKGGRAHRSKLDTREIAPINLLSATTIRDQLYLFVASTEDERSVISALTYRLPSLEPQSLARIAETDRIVFIKSMRVGGKCGLAYKHQQDGNLGLGLALQNDGFWRNLKVEGVRGLDVARIDTAGWVDGRALIVLSGEKKGRHKQHIYAAATSNGENGLSLRRIDTPEGSSTRAWLPDVAVSGDQVAVVWEDSRDIRATVRMQLSPSRGQSWLANDVQVSDGQHHAVRPRIQAYKGNLYIAWYQYRTDARKEADPILMHLRWQDAFAMAQHSSKRLKDEKKRLLLTQAVTDYWDAMMNRDLRKVYEHQDPFYRARVPFDAFAAQRGRFVYHSYAIRDVKIDGNVAEVQSTTNFEIPKLVIMGHEESLPPRDFPIKDTWLFVDGVWYREYVDALSGGTAVKY